MNRNDIGTLRAYGREKLKNNAVPSYALDADVLLMRAAGLNRVELLTGLDPLDESVFAKYHDYLSLREEHMPVAYITNTVEFMSLELYIDNRALIPRPDTEILVEHALEIISKRRYTNALELCTGSGCIALALAHYSGINVTAVDICPDALAVAKINAQHSSVELLQGDLFAPVDGRGFDMILANPPYISAIELSSLEKNVRYEPLKALDGGSDGLDFYRRICAGLDDVLNSGGTAMLEIGYNQAAAVTELFTQARFSTETVKDLAGYDRVIIAQREE